MRTVLWVSTAAICALTFVWPAAISADPEQAAFKLPAIAALIVFFAALLGLLAKRIREAQ
jgi:hypothetical protein